jgi:DNA-binding NarL/FixJ family response regulator
LNFVSTKSGWENRMQDIRPGYVQGRSPGGGDRGSLVAEARATLAKLDANELAFLAGVAAGESTRMIARRLRIGLAVAEDLRRTVMAKLGAVRTCDAVRIALRGGLDTAIPPAWARKAPGPFAAPSSSAS